ncbi:MAG: hypothetical protein EZS28_046841 [Streblomastix strix]|uniref:Uncharacterized protein n=1 Tax=Streblomastix strix TaxID=222440 RepID=A0A5J4TIH7_9EUKA|nr:MAG: hypothetical protein EZS28_046841 [Streblomastix strix]
MIICRALDRYSQDMTFLFISRYQSDFSGSFFLFSGNQLLNQVVGHNLGLDSDLKVTVRSQMSPFNIDISSYLASSFNKTTEAL